MSEQPQPNFKTVQDYIFTLSEQDAAKLIGVCSKTVSNHRINGRMPTYLYRNFGTQKKPWYRYNEILLMRWFIVTPEQREQEREWAIAQIDRALAELQLQIDSVLNLEHQVEVAEGKV